MEFDFDLDKWDDWGETSFEIKKSVNKMILGKTIVGILSLAWAALVILTGTIIFEN